MSNSIKFFVGGLAFTTTTAAMQAYFSQFGVVTDVIAMVRPDGTPRGFGFVTFEDQNALDVQSFLAFSHTLDGRQVEIKSAVSREEKLQQPQTGNQPASGKLFVGGLDMRTTTESLQAYFASYGNIINAIVMSGRNFGFIEYASSEQAEQVLASGPHVVDGKAVDLKRAQPKGTPGIAAPRQGYAPVAMYPSPYGYAGYGAPAVSPYAVAYAQPSPYSFARAAPRGPAPISTPPQQSTYGTAMVTKGCTESAPSAGAKLFMGGIPLTVSEFSLVDHFSNFGVVIACEVMRKDNISRGFGFIVFQSDAEAAAALSYVPHTVEGRNVELKACSPKTAEKPPPKMFAQPYGGQQPYGVPGVYRAPFPQAIRYAPY